MVDPAPVFGSDIATNYNRYLVPLIFDRYAAELATNVAAEGHQRVLEIACGTGAVTQHLVSRLGDARVIATDINPGMLDIAKTHIEQTEHLAFQVADGTDLPFEDAHFDAVVCQFGVMFYPDKDKGYSEALRVLKPGGRFHFTVWDSLEHNALAQLVHEASRSVSTELTFMTKPYGYCDVSEIKSSLERVGFQGMEISVQPRFSEAGSAAEVVLGLVDGSPLSAELAAAGLLNEGRDAVQAALHTRYGTGSVSAPMQAIRFSASKSS
ncbi:MAG: methyltransferase domain-containing protein [Pseudomonadota bacterium]